MQKPSILDFVPVQPVDFMVSGLAGTAPVALVVVVNAIIDREVVQFGLIGILVLVVATFVYKTEVKRHDAEFTSDKKTVRQQQQKTLSDDDALLVALNMALGNQGLSDYVLPELRH
jgi:hypothetical protein